MHEDDIPRPPYSADLLADLHAGVLDDEVAAALWPRVRGDARAMEVIRALDEVQMRVRALGPEENMTDESVPPEVAARIDAALAAQQAQVPAVHPRFRRRAALVAAVGIAAAAVLAVALTVRTVTVERGDGEVLATGSPATVHVEETDELDRDALLAVFGSFDTDVAENPRWTRNCLESNGFGPGTFVLGTKRITVDETDAVVLVISGGPDAGLIALLVETRCSADDPAIIRRVPLG